MAVVPSRPLPPGIPPDWAGARRLFMEATAGLACRDLLHVDNPSCAGAWRDMMFDCLLGATKFFVPFYAVHLLWNGRKALAGDKAFYRQMAYYYARSIVFGVCVGLTFSVTSCGVVRLTNGFSFWTSVFVPGALSGLAILIEHVYRRRIVMNTFFNMTLHYLYIRAQVAGLVRRTATGETAFFMAANALLMYLLHKASTRKEKKATIFWFYIPESERRESRELRKKRCPAPHKGACWNSALQASARYSALAASLQALRILMSQGGKISSSPMTFIRELISKRTFAGITSIGGYVLLYKIVRCALASWYGYDRCENSAVAGLISGTAYWLQPNTTILISAVTAIIRLLYDYLPKPLSALGQWPMPEILFALCNGILFHARCMDMAHCPMFMIRMMDTATHNRSKLIYATYLKLIDKVQANT